MGFNLKTVPSFDVRKKAFPFQVDAIRAIKDLPYAAVFHEQGLGKTKIAIDVVSHWLSQDIVDTVFIVTKKSLVKNWVDEITYHSHIKPSVLSEKKGRNNMALNAPILLYVLNYEVILSNIKLYSLFLKTCRVGVVLDESQKIKNPESKLTKSFFELSNSFYKKIIMTGTPVANRPFDIWSQIYFLDSGKSLGNSFQDFKNRTDIPKESNTTNSDSEMSDAQNSQIQVSDTQNLQIFSDTLSEIWNSIQEFTVRETKKSSGIELPSKTIITTQMVMKGDQANIYANYQNKLMHELIDEKGNLILDDAELILKRLLRLIQCASNPAILDRSYTELPIKFLFLQEKLKEITENNNKVIIWTSFIDSVEWLCWKLEKYQPCKIHGSISIDDRNNSIKRFKNDPSCQIMIATPGAAKEGLTLTVANFAIFYDRSFSLDDYLQAQDRIHRISQKQKCTVINLIAKNTIDEWVDELLNAKFQAAQLAQGDISKEIFVDTFDFDLSRMLQQILNNNLQEEII